MYLDLRYNMTEDEIQEMLLCIQYKKQGGFYRWNLYLITALCVFIIIEYMLHPELIFLFAVGSGMIVLLLFLYYYPEKIRKKKCRQILERGGEFRFKMTDRIICFGDHDEKTMLAGKKLELLESQTIYALRLERNAFGIPKRLLTERQEEWLKAVVHEGKGRIVRIQIVEG